MLAIGDPFFARHGPKAVFLGRWITGLRVWTSWLAGASDMRWPTFLVWNALGGTAWATSVGLAAYFGGNGVEEGLQHDRAATAGVAAVALIVLAIGYVWWRLRKRRRGATGVIAVGWPAVRGRTASVRSSPPVGRGRAARARWAPRRRGSPRAARTAAVGGDQRNRRERVGGLRAAVALRASPRSCRDRR